MKFEIKDRDLCARIGKIRIGSKSLETPAIFPVIKKRRKGLKKMGFQGVIMNAYLLLKDGFKGDVHRFFDGVVMTDSGAYQLMLYGGVEVSNREVMDYQVRIKSDIGVILDVPSYGRYEEVKKGVIETFKRAKEWKEVSPPGNWVGPVQGATYPDLLRKSAKFMRSLDFDMYAVGSVVPYLTNYDFLSVFKQGMTVLPLLPRNKPVHCFGAGLPMVMPFLVAIGYDTFDSASYALYAREGRYMTRYGTRKISELKELPCNCPVCSSREVDEMDEEAIAEHNLWVLSQTMKEIRQAIREGRLFELMCQYATSHPRLLEAFKFIVRRGKYFWKDDPIRKRKAVFYLGFRRPEVERAEKRVKERLGRMSPALSMVYPFNAEGMEFEFEEKELSDYELIRDISLYQFGANIFPRNVKIEKGGTGRIRRIYLKGELLATLRNDGFFSLKMGGARLLHRRVKGYRVIVGKEVEEVVRRGGNVFAKFVQDVKGEILPREEVLVVNEKDELLAVGTSLLNSREMKEFDYGLAVKVRDSLSPTSDSKKPGGHSKM
ncbi:MAG TPA: tRNA guanosine(15) transglycosylase TgtA [Candidatus Aenigmarchaeota archaeon]|nr:tRNA guanosine(15) transglycosylase TgtA [Candidatus Aenigmarchaeota archaeon]